MTSAANTSASTPRVDTHLGKFSQACTIILSALAFLLNQPIVVVIAAIVMIIAAAIPTFSPYRLLYKYIIVPLGLLKPHVIEDDPAPHRFAQGVGAVFLVASSILLLFTHATALGWALDLIVFALATINLTVGFCAGCFVYYHLGRLGVLPKVRYQGSFHWRGV